MWNPPLLSKKVWVAENLRNTERFVSKVFWYCGNKKFRPKIVTPALPSLWSKRLIHTVIFLKHRTVPLRNFLVLWDQKFRRKIVTTVSPLFLDIFWYQKFPGRQKSSCTKWFGIIRQNNFHGKSWYHLPLLS